MPRVLLYDNVVRTTGPSLVQIAPGSSIQVNILSTGLPATLYAAAVGAGTVPNPLTADAAGRFAAYVTSGVTYQVLVSGPGVTSYTVEFEAISAETLVRSAAADSPINTSQLWQSESNDDASLQTSWHGLYNTPSKTGISTLADYADSSSTATTIYQLAGGIYNTGTRPAVAVGGFARGQQVWGSNLVVMADGVASEGCGMEIDFGIVTANVGQCIGLALHAHNNAGNPAMYLQILSRAGLAHPEPMTGIQVAVNGNLARTTSGAQIPDTTTTLVLADSTGVKTASMFTYNGNVYDYTSVTGNTLNGVTLFYGTAGLSIPNGATVNFGDQPVYQPGYLFKVSGAVCVNTGIDLSPGIYRAAGIVVPLNSTVAGIGINLVSQGGGTASGSGLQFTALDSSSTVSFGIRFHGITGGIQGVATGGTLIYVDGGTYAKALDLAAATFAASGAIVMGDNNISFGTTTGCKIGTGTTQKMALWNTTPIVKPAAMTQTYNTADRTLSAYTADVESTAYTGAADGEAKLVDLNALRVAYENLRAFAEDVAQFLNSHIDDEQSFGFC